jgi:AcrR family transcriptional regulator
MRMSEGVKPKRRYDSARRRAQAAQTRQDILAAAHDAFLENGYTGTTVSAIARRAGVVVETIYRAFGGKAALFKSVVETAVAGGAARADVPPDERPAIRAVIAETDPYRQIRLYADTQPGIHARIGPLLRILAGATDADPALADVLKEMEDQRLGGMDRFAHLLADRGALRPGLDADGARDQLWTLCSHEVYDRLVEQRGWATDRYRDWLADTLCRVLLG